MKKAYIIIFALGFLVSSIFLVNKIFAQTADLANIQYPVAELGNCESQEACKTYCNKKENTDACMNFAAKNNLMSSEEIKIAEKFLLGELNGPGGCTTKESCNEYCDGMNHIDECISFAEKNNLLSSGELQEAKKVQAAIKKGIKPPNCNNKKECDAYCESSDHMEECITFGMETGFLQGQELENAKKMLQAIKSGVTPPNCKGKDACDEYCSNPDHMEECINFSIAAGMMPEEEKANSEKMLEALKKGIKPPNCKGKEECDTYCQQEAHFEECTNFAVAAGYMTEENAAMARKTGGKGPGGCTNQEECDAFCNNPDNQETCFNFAKDNGLMSEEDLKQMEEGRAQMQQSLQQASTEVINCLNAELGTGVVEKMKNGLMPSKDLGEKMQTCFQKVNPPQNQEPGEPGAGGMIPPANQTGPGGCKTEEECKAYCEGNPTECQKFQPAPGEINPGSQTMPQQAGPGGCKTPEECKAYCEGNPDVCQNFQSTNIQQQGSVPQMQPGQIQPQEGQQQYPQQGEQQTVTQPSSEPGSGGSLAPGEMVPLIQPTEQQAPQEQPQPTSFLMNPDSLVASATRAFFQFLVSQF